MNCGFGQINPKIDQNDLNNYYENIYRSKNSVMHFDFNKASLDMNILDYRSISQLLLCRQYLCSKNKYHFLDIGAGPGNSFISARKILGNVSLSAIESNSDAKQFYKKSLDNISIYEHLADVNDGIDVLLMSHSLEHFGINDMQVLFQDIHNVLTDDGVAIIEIPHMDLRNSNVLKDRFNDTPHLSFFSLESLSKLIDKFEFELCFINTVGSLLTDSYSKTANITREHVYKTTNRSVSAKRAVKDSIKQAAKHLGFYGYLYNINATLKRQGAFCDDINFKYGGKRDLLRCVIKKNNSA